MFRKRSIVANVAAFALLEATAAYSQATAAYSSNSLPKPEGIYVLNEASDEQSTDSAYAAGLTSSPAYESNIEGHAIFVPIAKILPSVNRWGEFKWDWTYLDTLVNIAVKNGKKFSVALEAGFQSSSTFSESLPVGFATACGANCAPLFDVWVTGGSGGRCTSAYVLLPWVPKVQEFWIAAAFALSIHLRQTGAYSSLTLIHVPGLSIYDEELRLPTGKPAPDADLQCPDGRYALAPDNAVASDASDSRWEALGYSDAAVERGFGVITAAFALAFPDRFLGLSLLNPGPDGIDFPNLTSDPVGLVASQIVREVTAIAPGRVQLQSDNLDSNFAQPEVLSLSAQYNDLIGWQSNKHAETGAGCAGGGADSCKDGPDGPYFQLLQNGAIKGGEYLEVWSNDVVSYPEAFAASQAAGYYPVD